MEDAEEEEDDVDEETSLKHARPRQRLPTQPVITADEKELFSQYRDKPRFKLTGSLETGKPSVDWGRMALEWNRFIRKNHWMNHSSDKIFYLKTASHLREYNNALLLRENAARTMGQVQNAGSGTTYQQVAQACREQLRDASAVVPPAASVPLAQAAPNATGELDGGIRPPASTQQVHQSAFSGRRPTALVSTSAPAAPKQSCGRCSGFKGGSDHKTGAAINSEEYCTAFGKLSSSEVAGLLIDGFPKPGYSVGESAPKRKSSAHKCGRCGLKREGTLHSSKTPFCTVPKDDWEQGHVPAGVWAFENGLGEGGAAKKREDQSSARAKRARRN